MELSPRLARLVEAVPQGWPVADIGTDHAYIPVTLVQRGIIPGAVAGDIHPGPLEAARRHVAAFGMSDKVQVRAGDGLDVLRPGEAKTVIIAGMGGGTIQSILATGESAGKLKDIGRLILQPLEGAGGLRQWLAANGWDIIEEDLVAEGQRIYEVIILEPGAGQGWKMEELNIPHELIWELGPLLLAEKHPLLIHVVTRLLDREGKALEGMKRGRTVNNEALKIKEARIKDLERVISWLSPAPGL